MKNLKIFFSLSLASATLLLSGCIGDFLSPKPDPTAFYRMSSPAELAPEETYKSSVSATIMPISIPPYMERSQIVTLGSGNKVQIAEYNRWAELPASGISRIVAENISRLSGNSEILLYPSITYDSNAFWVRVFVSECIGALDAPLTFRARWQLIDTKDKSEIITKDISKTYPVGSTYDSYAEAINLACLDLSKEIALGLKEFQNKKSKK